MYGIRFKYATWTKNANVAVYRIDAICKNERMYDYEHTMRYVYVHSESLLKTYLN